MVEEAAARAAQEAAEAKQAEEAAARAAQEAVEARIPKPAPKPATKLAPTMAPKPAPAPKKWIPKSESKPEVIDPTTDDSDPDLTAYRKQLRLRLQIIETVYDGQLTEEERKYKRTLDWLDAYNATKPKPEPAGPGIVKCGEAAQEAAARAAQEAAEANLAEETAA